MVEVRMCQRASTAMPPTIRWHHAAALVRSLRRRLGAAPRSLVRERGRRAGSRGAGKRELMLTLLGGFLAATPNPRSRIALWASAGIVLSLAGDVLFAQPGDTGFILGLGGFLLAHVAYT